MHGAQRGGASCHSEPVRTLAWESVAPCLPLRGRCQREALTEGEMPRVFLSPSRLRRQPPPRGGLTARRCRADGTSRTPSPTKTTRRPLRGAAPACQRTPAFATVSGEIFTFWIGAQNLAGNCCDFDGGICGRGTDCHGAARLAMTARRRRADGAMWASSPTKNDHPFGWSFSTLLCSCQRTSSPTVGLLAA